MKIRLLFHNHTCIKFSFTDEKCLPKKYYNTYSTVYYFTSKWSDVLPEIRFLFPQDNPSTDQNRTDIILAQHRWIVIQLESSFFLVWFQRHFVFWINHSKHHRSSSPIQLHLLARGYLSVYKCARVFVCVVCEQVLNCASFESVHTICCVLP